MALSRMEKMGRKVTDAKAFDEAGAKTLRYQLLIFSRWCQVMLRFEKAMYEDPAQDLNRLWWDLVERYQGLKRPPGRSEPAASVRAAHHLLLGHGLAVQAINASSPDAEVGRPLG